MSGAVFPEIRMSTQEARAPETRPAIRRLYEIYADVDPNVRSVVREIQTLTANDAECFEAITPTASAKNTAVSLVRNAAVVTQQLATIWKQPSVVAMENGGIDLSWFGTDYRVWIRVDPSGDRVTFILGHRSDPAYHLETDVATAAPFIAEAIGIVIQNTEC
ncbi:MAG: hypothetical protein ACLQVD_16900 [Capsulimonadaceae bacterium]